MRMLLEYKYSQVFREVVKFPTLDFCDAIAAKSPLHLLTKAIFNLVEKFADFTNTSCPLSSIRLINFLYDYDQMPTIFASGDVRATTTFVNEEDDKIFETIMVIEIKSSERTNWG